MSGFDGRSGLTSGWNLSIDRLASRMISGQKKYFCRHARSANAQRQRCDRWRGVAYLLIALVAAAVVWFNRPVTLGVVFWTLVLALVVLLIVELLRRPADEVAETTAEAAAAEVAADAASDDEADTLVLAEGVVVDTGESTTPPASPSDPARRTD